MASMRHEGLLLLFRNRPSLAPELLRDVLGVGLPTYTEARIESAELTEVVPTEHRADQVVLLLDGKPVFAILVKVQLGRDEDKWMTWPLYLTRLRSRVRCPTSLLVVAPDPAVAWWCAQPIELGHPGCVLWPLVVGSDSIPVITDEQVARHAPELAVLSAMAHGEKAMAHHIARAALAAARGLDEARGRLYVEIVESSLNNAARAALKKLMQNGKYEYQSDFARKYYAQGFEEGLQQAREERRQQRLEEGRQQGLEEGFKDGWVISILEVLDVRGIALKAEARQRIQACADLAQLKVWLRRALTVRNAEELFGE